MSRLRSRTGQSFNEACLFGSEVSWVQLPKNKNLVGKVRVAVGKTTISAPFPTNSASTEGCPTSTSLQCPLQDKTTGKVGATSRQPPTPGHVGGDGKGQLWPYQAVLLCLLSLDVGSATPPSCWPTSLAIKSLESAGHGGTRL